MAHGWILLLAWLLVNDGKAQHYKRATRKVLPLEHPLGRKLDNQAIRHLQVTYDSKDTAQQKGSGSTVPPVGGATSHAGNSRGGDGGFIGDGLSIIRGRTDSHNGGSQLEPGSGGHLNSMPASGPNKSWTHKTHVPSYSPAYYPQSYSDDENSYSYDGKGKGTKKSHHHSKSKSKSKSSKERSYEYGGESIDGGYMGADEIHPPSGNTDDVGDVPTYSTPPLEADPVTISLTPFGLQYELAAGVGTPTSDEYAMAIDVTIGYLNTYMNLQYEGLGLQDFTTSATSTIWREGVPQIDFVASATFRSSSPPSLEELDSTLTQAFTGASLAIYLNMLQTLPAENKFSTTTGAKLTNPANLGGGSRSSLIENVGAPGIAGAVGAGALVFMAIGLMIYGKQQKRTLPSCPAEAAGERRALRPKKRPLTKVQRLQAQLLGYHDTQETTTANDETTTCSSDSTVKSGLSRLVSARSTPPRIPLSIGPRHQVLPQNDTELEKEEKEEEEANTEDPLSRDIMPSDPPVG